MLFVSVLFVWFVCWLLGESFWDYWYLLVRKWSLGWVSNDHVKLFHYSLLP